MSNTPKALPAGDPRLKAPKLHKQTEAETAALVERYRAQYQAYQALSLQGHIHSRIDKVPRETPASKGLGLEAYYKAYLPQNRETTNS